MKEQTCIMILGMHRSGTSALTGLLQYLKVSLGNKTAGPADDNVQGFFENENIVKYNEKILASLGTQWDTIYFDYNKVQENITVAQKEELKQLLESEFSEETLFAIKDPRICYLFPLYAEILLNLKVNIKILLPYRNPLEVAKSLHVRNNFTQEKSELLWLSYFLHAEKHSRNYHRLFLNFDDLLRFPEKSIKSIDEKLNTNLLKEYAAKKGQIEKFLDKNLKHQNEGVYRFSSFLKTVVPQLEFFLEKDFNAVDVKIFDDIREEYFGVGKFFYQLLLVEQNKIVKLQDDLTQQTSWAKELDEKNREKIETIRRLQDDLTQQTSWAKELDEKNREKIETIRRLQDDLTQQTSWAKELDEKNREKIETIRRLQDDLTQQTSWAKELDEKNREKIETIRKLQDDLTQQTSWAKKLSHDNVIYMNKIDFLQTESKKKEIAVNNLQDSLNTLQELEDEHKKEIEALKYQNNLMFARLKKMEASKIIMFWEKFLQLKEEPYKNVAKKILSKLLPEVVPLWLKKKRNFAIIEQIKNTKSQNIIVVFPIIAWGFRWQRPQHLLSGLAKKGYTVLYVSKDFIFEPTTKEERKTPLACIKMQQLEENIFKIHLNSMKPLNIYKDILDEHNTHWFMQQIMYVLASSGQKEPVYFVQFPNWLNLVKQLQTRVQGKILFDCMDEHSGFSNVDRQIIEQERELIEMSDLVISSSNKLHTKNKKLNSNAVKVKNGTEFDFFSTVTESDVLGELTSKPIVGYYGAIAEWFDIDLIEYCAQQRPEYNFVLIGSTFSCDTTNIKKLKNVFFLGEKPYITLTKYLYKFDVCTIPFKIIPLIEATNPVKFYEYISAGKPVVATKLPELEEYKEVCYLANNKKEFLEMLDQAINEAKSPNKHSLTKKRISVAQENSWNSRVDILHENIKRLVYEA
ncbi:glycosyltransferase [Sulfurimonas sp. SWIR-19]|uniref:glycosyltransferase n=1 Tax=Sulfurimonas sp. SWIR-19 TaxID=2878390 RepID=UPI001CF25647|nr:glycosyltransferase [Sulfurimonas sp. SWIR-19]UCN00603.1 glycosyltransferase [Sulfurimonas sp. SWIR-19]